MRLDGFIGAQIARGNRNLLIWNAVILVGLVVAFWFARVYIYNFFLGPFPADDKALLAIAGSDGASVALGLHGVRPTQLDRHRISSADDRR